MFQLPGIPQCPQAGHDGGGERWLISYADMITLLLVLFIILYSTATQDLEKFKAVSQSLSQGFGATVPNMSKVDSKSTTGAGDNMIMEKTAGGTTPLEMYPENQSPIQIFQFARMMDKDSELRKDLEKAVDEAVKQAEKDLHTSGLKGDISVSYNERGIVIDISPDQILFDPGSAELKPGFRRVMLLLAKQFARLPNDIEVQGHTDSIPISTRAYPSNWELSAARAGAVIRYLGNLGLPKSRLSAAGYGDTRPVADNSTAEGRAKNRRVEIVILRNSSDVDPKPASARAMPADGAGPADSGPQLPPASKANSQSKDSVPPAGGKHDGDPAVSEH